MSRLTEKQRRFVEAYMGEAAGNATEAARLAGYSGDDNTLASIGSENLRKPKIRESIKERVVNDPLVASREELQRFWSKVMRGEEQDTNIDREGNTTPVPPSMKDRLKASELLGKSRGEFKEKLDVTNDGGAFGSMTPEDAMSLIREYREWKDGLND